MNKSPFFSVVIPTYNCADFLKRALSSVFVQTYQNFEVIVVDNSSTDNTEDVLNSFDDKRLTVKNVNNNGIIAHSRNKGIKNAIGDWIAFLDSDDVWNSDKLMKVKNAINQNPKVIIICHDEWHMLNNKKKYRLRYGPAGKDLYERLVFKGNCLSTSAVCLNREVAIKSGGFSEREDFVTVEDYEYWIRLAQEGECYFINEILGEWHTHDDNYSSNVSVHVNAFIKVKEHHFNLWLTNSPGVQQKVNLGRSKMYFDASRILQKGKRYLLGAKYSIKSIFLNPFQWKPWATLILCLFRINKK